MKFHSLFGALALVVLSAGAFGQNGASAPLSPAPVGAAQPVGVQVTARSTAVIAAPMAGQLMEFPAADGDSVKEGQVLARRSSRDLATA